MDNIDVILQELRELKDDIRDLRKLTFRIAILVAGGASAPGIIHALGM